MRRATWWGFGTEPEHLPSRAPSFSKRAPSSYAQSGIGYKDGVPCTHLFTDGAHAYLYSTDEKHCCMSSAPASEDKCHLTRPQVRSGGAHPCWCPLV